MFTCDQTGRLTSPHPDLQKTVCGSCAVCKTHLKSFTQPKLLPCLHTVCHDCLTKTRKDEGTYECPLCAQSFCLFEATECVVFEDSSDNTEDPKCAACEETEISGWCIQCEEALCLDCVSAHRRVKVTRDHEVVTKKPPTGWMPRRRCPIHRQESLRFFCLVCEKLTCKDCQLITHRGHSFVQQEEAVVSQRQQLLSLLESIKNQKETVSTSLQLLEARLIDLEEVKSQISKALTQVVHSIYYSLLLRAKQILKEVEALCAEEVKGLLERKTFLNRMEGCQDYIAAFIDKILSTEGHCLLVHKKRIETQVKKLLSQKSCPPETMFELQIQLKKDYYQNILKSDLMRVKTVPVPFTSRMGSTLAKSGERSDPSSNKSNADVHPLPASSSSDQSTEVKSAQSQQAQSNTAASSNGVTNVSSCKTPSVYSQPCPPSEKPTAPLINNISQSGKPRKTWTFHYYPALQVPSQSIAQTHLVSTNTSTPISTYNRTSRITHPIPANNHTPVLQHPLPDISTDTQTPVLAQVIPANSQTHVLTLPIPTNKQTPAFPQPILTHNQPPIFTLPIPANNQTPILTHPVSSMSTDTQTLILAHPIQANVLGAMHTFAAQPNMALTVPSTINTLLVKDVPAMYSGHCTGAPHKHDSFALNPTSPTLGTTPNTDSSSLPADLKNSAHHSTNLPVKALADSACDHEASVSSTDSTDTNNPENNLPTSTVSEPDPEEPSPAPVEDPACSAFPSSILDDVLSTTSTQKCSPGRSSHCLLRSPAKGSQAQAGHSSLVGCSEPKHWSVNMPTSFRQLVERTYIPACLINNRNDPPRTDSAPCSVSESITLLTSEMTTTAHDKTVRSDFGKEDAKEEDKESAVTLEHAQQFKRFLRVTLVRLPISLPPCGQPLPQFHLFTDPSADQILVQETLGGQIKQVWRWNEGPVPSRTSSCSVSQDSNSPLLSEVQFCTVCQSAGATLLCSQCGRAFHSDCHIPPISVNLCNEWVCLLCLNVNDEIIVYGSEQKLSLSLQDQRKCEKLLLSLLCDENRYLLYSVQRHSKMAEFDIILGRLLGKQKPPYRTAAELVSDVWTLFDILLTNSERRDMVVKLQKSFQQQLNESFGKSLHASLLRCSSSEDSRNTSEVRREKHKTTLKRMREFFTANCGISAKKPYTERGKKTAASEH